MLTRQISSECVHCVSAFGGQKPQFWANFDFWGLLYRPPFTDEGQIWYAIASRPTVYAYVPNFVSISLFSRPLLAKTPIFAVFWTLALRVVANWKQSEKVEHGCTITNIPLSNGIKIVSVLQRLHSEMGRTISDVQNRDEQTNGQTDKKLKFLATPAAGEIRAQPNLTR